MLVVIIVHGRSTSAFLILLFIFCLLLLSSHFRTPLTPLLNIFLFSRCKYKRFSLFDLLFDILSLPQCRDQRDSRFSRIFFHFHFSFSISSRFNFTFTSRKRVKGFFFTFHFSKKVKAICISLFFLEKKE